MTPQLLFNNITCISFFLLALVAFFNPAKLNNLANKWFGLFLFSAGCMVLNSIIYKAHAEAAFGQLLAFNELSRFMMAPALYLSVLHFTSSTKVFKSKEYLHFIPFALFFVYMSPVVFMPDYKSAPVTQLPDAANWILYFLMSASVKIQLLVYWGLAWLQLNRHQRNIRLVNSVTTEINLSWLRHLLFSIVVMQLTWMLAEALNIKYFSNYSPVFYLVGVLLIGYNFLAQKEVYPFEDRQLGEISEVIAADRKPANQRFTAEQLVPLKVKLEALMGTEKVYLNPELSLPELANEMGCSPHDLSYLINEGFGISFFRFVNAYRVKEAKRLILSGEYKHLNILGIAYSAGFNSKTTFNTAFKTQTGMSPSDFIKQYKSDLSPAAS